MKLHVYTPGQAELSATTALVLPRFEDIEQAWGDTLAEVDGKALTSIIEDEGFKGKKSECYVLPTPASAYRCVVLMGLGKFNAFDAEVLRRAAGDVCSAVKSHSVDHVVLDSTHAESLPVEAFIEGIILGGYDLVFYLAATITIK